MGQSSGTLSFSLDGYAQLEYTILGTSGAFRSGSWVLILKTSYIIFGARFQH